MSSAVATRTEAALPAYQVMLDAYHSAWESNLRQIILNLPLGPSDHVLDVGCGDGFYSRLLVRRVMPRGTVTGLDESSACLALAQERSKKLPIIWEKGKVERLPFSDNTFDFVWCAQSLYSFPDPLAAMKEMARVVRPHGFVAVLENDSLHQFILPWPAALELKIRAAELQAFKVENQGSTSKFYVGRSLRFLFEEAGLLPSRKRTFSSNRHAPLGPDSQAFFAEYLKTLRRRISPYLNGALPLCDRFLNPHSPAYLLKDPSFVATSIDHVMWGLKPSKET